MTRIVDTGTWSVAQYHERKSRGLRDPSSLQSEEEAEEYRRSLKEGDKAVIRTTYAMRLTFILTTVTSTKSGRVYTNADHNELTFTGHGRGSIDSWFMKSGKNCNAPAGQASLVAPSEEVLDFIAEHGSRGPLDWYK